MSDRVYRHDPAGSPGWSEDQWSSVFNAAARRGAARRSAPRSPLPAPGNRSRAEVDGYARELLRHLHELTVGDWYRRGRPVPVDEVARRLNLTVSVSAQAFDGHLSEWTGRIVVRAGSSPTRRTFTIGHEVGHALVARLGPKLGWAAELTADDLERLCDAFAARLLVPDRELAELGGAPELATIRVIAANLGVSTAVVTNRAFAYRRWDCVVARWHLVGERWRVRSTAGGPWDVRSWQVHCSDLVEPGRSRHRELAIVEPFRGIAHVEMGAWSRHRMTTLIKSFGRS